MMVANLWGEAVAGRLALLAIGGAGAGLLGAVPVLPNAVLLIAIGAFVLIGPGSLLLTWYGDLPTDVLCALVPVIGIAVSILVVSGLLLLGVYAPLPILLGMAATTLVGGLIRRRRLTAPRELAR
jgi:hypothetical protein